MTDQERKDFEGGLPVTVTIGEEVITMRPKLFSTGSCGWHGNTKIILHGHRAQLNLLATVVGSKPSPKSEQVSTVPEKAPEAPPSDSEPEKGHGPAKVARKRS